jgi:predicted enzyme related to lactoylglutathione lyase
VKQTIGYAVLVVRDYDEVIKFYVDVLGDFDPTASFPGDEELEGFRMSESLSAQWRVTNSSC